MDLEIVLVSLQALDCFKPSAFWRQTHFQIGTHQNDLIFFDCFLHASGNNFRIVLIMEVMSSLFKAINQF